MYGNETDKWYEKMKWEEMLGGIASIIVASKAGSITPQPQIQQSSSILGNVSTEVILVGGIMAIAIISIVAMKR
jgi:hypothetical protein